MNDLNKRLIFLRVALGVVALCVFGFVMQSFEEAPFVWGPAVVAFLIAAASQILVPSLADFNEREERIVGKEQSLKSERSRLKEEDERLKKLAQDTRNFENKLRLERQELEGERSQVEALRVKTEQAQDKAREDLRKVTRTQERIEKEQTELDDTVRSIEQREHDLEQGAVKLNAKIAKFNTAHEESKHRQERLELDFASRQRELAGANEQFEQLCEKIRDREAVLMNLAEKTTHLDQREADLQSRERQLDEARQNLLEKEQAAISAKQEVVEQAELNRRNAESVETKVKAFQADRQALENERREFAEHVERFKDREKQIASLEESSRVERERIASHLDTLKSQQVSVDAQLAKAVDVENQGKAKAAEAEQKLQKVIEAKSEIESLLSCNWGRALGNRKTEPSVEQLNQHAKTDGDAALVLAYLQLLGAVRSSDETQDDFNQLAPPIRGIGKFLSNFLRNHGKNAGEVASQMADWASALNLVSEGRYEIAVPAPGETFRGSSMQTIDDEIDTVSEVRNWAISNDRSIVAHRAEVA